MTKTSETDPLLTLNPSIGVESDHNNEVTLTVWLDRTNNAEPLRLRLSTERAASLLRDLTNHTTYALAGAVTSVARGDCSTCANTRMVNRPRNGRDWQEHCPDCTIDPRPSGFPRLPQIGGGLA